MRQHNTDTSHVQRSIRILATLLVFSNLLCLNVSATTHMSLPIQPCATVTVPPVILEAGTAGTSTIYTNNTSAKVNVVAMLPIYDFVDNNTSDVDLSGDFGTHGNFSGQQVGPDSVYDTLRESGRSAQLNISASWGADVNNLGSKYPNDGSDWVGYDGYYSWRTANKFPLTDLPSGSTVTKVEVIFRVSQAGSSTHLCDIHPYNGNGQANPETDSGSTMYTRCATGTEYVNDNTSCRTTGLATIDLGSQACTDVTNAKSAVNRFSLGWHEEGDNSGQAKIDEYTNPTSPPKLKITYVETHELDLEVQWTNVDYDEMNEQLAIYAHKGNNTHSLDATGGYMIVGNGTPNWGSTTGTISAWVNWDIVANRPWGQHENMEIRFSGTNLVLDWGASSSLTSSTSFVAGKWYFIAIVWNENTDNLYLYMGDKDNSPTLDTQNGVWASTVSTIGVTQNNFMASKGGANPTDGRGDDLRYWNVARTLAEIQGDYNIELTGSEANLRSYFKLNNNFDDIGSNNNDGSGSGSYSFSSDVPLDASPTENLRVDVWNGSAWQNLLIDLENGWNNVSVSSFLNSSTFTIRFKGNSEIGDTTQDSWNIDATLLHVWAPETYDYVLKIVNQVADNWQVSLKVYDNANIGRLSSLDMSLHDGTTSTQIIISNGIVTQSEGNPYTLAGSATVYASVTDLHANTTGTSLLHVYLKIKVPGISTYSIFVVTFEIA